MSDERELPAAEHTTRDPWPAGVVVPRGPRNLQRGAEAAGWTVEMAYSRGWALPNAHALPPYRIHAISVRFERIFEDGRRRAGHVVYHCPVDGEVKWEAKSLMVHGSDHWPVVGCLNVTEVGRYLVDGVDWSGTEVASWRDDLKANLMQKKIENALKAKERGRKPRKEVS